MKLAETVYDVVDLFVAGHSPVLWALATVHTLPTPAPVLSSHGPDLEPYPKMLFALVDEVIAVKKGKSFRAYSPRWIIF